MTDMDALILPCLRKMEESMTLDSDGLSGDRSRSDGLGGELTTWEDQHPGAPFSRHLQEVISWSYLDPVGIGLTSVTAAWLSSLCLAWAVCSGALPNSQSPFYPN